MMVVPPTRPQTVDENHSPTQILNSLRDIELENPHSILEWIQVTDPLQYVLREDFPRNEIRTFFMCAGFAERVTRLQSLRVGNEQVHARRIVCYWLHQIQRVKKGEPPYNEIPDALSEWFSRYKK